MLQPADDIASLRKCLIIFIQQVDAVAMPLIRGQEIATPVYALARNDMVLAKNPLPMEWILRCDTGL